MGPRTGVKSIPVDLGVNWCRGMLVEESKILAVVHNLVINRGFVGYC